MDESQARCGSRYDKYSYRCEGNKPNRDYIKIISCSYSSSVYLLSFTVDTRQGDKISDLLYKTLLPIHETHREGQYKVSTDRFYTTVDNALMVRLQLGMYLYGTIREDRGPRFSNIEDT